MIGKSFGNYRIVEKLCKGATGTLFKAVDETLGREVAIKVLHPDLAETEVMKQFQTEVKALARLNHPEIATIHDVQMSAEAVLLVTELVKGENLDALIKRVGPLPAERAALLVTQILSALAHAHEVAVVHRDLKPTSVMVTELGTVKLLDFAMAPVEGAAQMTAASFALGTPAYMAPERILGNDVDVRADVYSVGVILYWLLTAKVPFDAPSATAMVQKQLGDSPTPLSAYRSDLPSWCQVVISRALAKAPAERFQSAADFRAALLDGVSSGSNETTGVYPAVITPASSDGPTLATAIPSADASALPLPTVDPYAATMLTAIPAAAFQPASGDEPTAPVDAPAADPLAATILTAMPVMVPVAVPTTMSGSRLVDVSGDVGPTLALPRPPEVSDLDQPTMLVPAASAPTVAVPLEALVETTTAPAAGTATLVMKRKQFAAASLVLGLLAVGVVVLVAVVLMRRTPPAEAPVSSAETVAVNTAPPTPVPTTTAPPPVVVPPAVAARPADVAPPPPLEISEPAIRTSPEISAASRTRGVRPAPAATPETATEVAPAGANPNVGLISNTAPLTFDGKAVVIDGDKRRERDASIRVAAGNVDVTFADGQGAYSLPISNLIGITYSNSRQPLWQSPTGPAEAMRVEGGGFLRGRRHWLGFRTPEALMMLRIEDAIVARVIAGVQERTGLTVARLADPKQ